MTHNNKEEGRTMKATRTLMSELLNLAVSDGIVTYTFKGGINPTNGFSIGHGERGFRVNYTPTPEQVLQAAKWFEKGGYDGLWMWVDDGYWYVDPILHIESRSEALMYGTAWKEKAIFDLSSKECIYL